ncbi:uncharacterized protein LY79DRAFT_675445 [Colletotrichum navitas]|uniref:Uncharacterized protein n=1 Tax=Colletotrichum navitas TaxID=681940 RepID=A0AAD8PIZ1_9PEZI|nr:uncharacterized protein LY79DRAFT_675445 [Colletotrichum navitas]KAK1561579.1 hypothetical protein LY79DRAFT_675445 [Colletotrichum navitas]
MLAETPFGTMMRFVSWMEEITSEHTVKSGKQPQIALIAHFGSCFDHVNLIRTMMKNDVAMLKVMLADSLTMFKVLKGKNCAKLTALRDKAFLVYNPNYKEIVGLNLYKPKCKMSDMFIKAKSYIKMYNYTNRFL